MSSTRENRRDASVLCHGLTKRYGTSEAQVMALRGVELEVMRGELLMLVGPSGCGKTTLISIIAGILDPDEGECTVLGQRLRDLKPDAKTAFRCHAVGFVFQAFNLIPQLQADENVMIPLLLNGVPRGSALSKAREILDRVGLAGRASASPTQLSGGQQQRVAVARALCTIRSSSFATSRPARSTMRPARAFSNCCGASPPVTDEPSLS